METERKTKRKLRLTTLEEETLKEDSGNFWSSPMSRDLKDLSECLNSTSVWNSETRTALEVSIFLLDLLINIYTENRGIIERFGLAGFGLISIHPSFQVYSTSLVKIFISDFSFRNLKQLQLNFNESISML